MIHLLGQPACIVNTRRRGAADAQTLGPCVGRIRLSRSQPRRAEHASSSILPTITASSSGRRRPGGRALSVRVLAYCVMPNHWHLVVWPQSDDGLSRFMHWLTGTHAQRWRWARGNQGRGAVYQGRFKAIAVQCDRHFLILCRYVERNPLRASLVACAQDWEWSSASPAAGRPGRPPLSEWPVPRPPDWVDYLNKKPLDPSVRQVRAAIQKGQHFGDEGWRNGAYEQLAWRSGRGPGRHRGSPTEGAASSGRESRLQN